MKRRFVGCAAAVLLCTCLFGRVSANAVQLKQTSDTMEQVLAAADQANLLPSSMDGISAQQTITKEQLCELSVRLYASLNNTEYDSLMKESTALRQGCPYTDTNSAVIQQAWALGLTEEETGVFSPDDMATRQQVIAMLYRAMEKSNCAVALSENETADTLYKYTDGAVIPQWARAGMTYFVREGLTSGTSNHKLGIGENVSAEQAAVLTYRAAAAIHTGRGISSVQNITSIAMHSGNNAVSWTGCGAEYYRISFYAVNDFSQAPIYTEQVTAEENGVQKMSLPQEIASQPGIWYWSVDAFDCSGKLIASAQQTAMVTVSAQMDTQPDGIAPQQEVEPRQEFDFISESIPEGLTSYDESYNEKVARIFGTGASYHKYANSSEAASHQVTVSVPVWDFDSNGNKITKTKRFQIHEALAPTVEQIFAEIYAGGEQFPIYSLGGYCWRGDGSSSEHCLGVAIDINPDENYMCTNSGKALTGTHWTPGSDPYSIPANGDVVRVFKKYGFGWGGDWNTKKDYMHFSYFGT